VPSEVLSILNSNLCHFVGVINQLQQDVKKFYNEVMPALTPTAAGGDLNRMASVHLRLLNSLSAETSKPLLRPLVTLFVSTVADWHACVAADDTLSVSDGQLFLQRLFHDNVLFVLDSALEVLFRELVGQLRIDGAGTNGNYQHVLHLAWRALGVALRHRRLDDVFVGDSLTLRVIDENATIFFKKLEVASVYYILGSAIAHVTRQAAFATRAVDASSHHAAVASCLYGERAIMRTAEYAVKVLAFEVRMFDGCDRVCGDDRVCSAQRTRCRRDGTGTT